jgi:hypothetical protein
LEVELLESSPDELLELSDEPDVPDVPVDVDPDDVEDPEVPESAVLEVPELLLLLAWVSVLATAAKASDPTAVAVNRPPVTMPTRRKPWSRLFMGRPPRGRCIVAANATSRPSARCLWNSCDPGQRMVCDHPAVAFTGKPQGQHSAVSCVRPMV